MKFIVVPAIILNLLTFSNALIINCDFKVHATYGFGCEATSIDISRPLEVERVRGLTRANDSIKYFIAKSDDITELPYNLEQFFPKLETINLDFPHLNRICSEDLKVFGENLKSLILQNSEVEYIPDDLFSSSPNVTYIYLKSSKDVKVGKNVFKPLNKLRTMTVRFECEEDDAATRQNVEEMISRMEIACYDPKYRAPTQCKSDRSPTSTSTTEKVPETTTESSTTEKTTEGSKISTTTEKITPTASGDKTTENDTPTTITPLVTTEKPREESNTLLYVIIGIIGAIMTTLIAVFGVKFYKKTNANSTKEMIPLQS